MTPGPEEVRVHVSVGPHLVPLEEPVPEEKPVGHPLRLIVPPSRLLGVVRPMPTAPTVIGPLPPDDDPLFAA